MPAPPPRPTATSYKHERIRHSPRKLNLIAKLVRRLWVPDALAQLQFTPKRFAPTVAAAIERCAQPLRKRPLVFALRGLL